MRVSIATVESVVRCFLKKIIRLLDFRDNFIHDNCIYIRAADSPLSGDKHDAITLHLLFLSST